jgi:CheY-like chemotaxis protein
MPRGTAPGVFPIFDHRKAGLIFKSRKNVDLGVQRDNGLFNWRRTGEDTKLSGARSTPNTKRLLGTPPPLDTIAGTRSDRRRAIDMYTGICRLTLRSSSEDRIREIFGVRRPRPVVIVDDDPRIRESLESLFDAAEIHARSFESAEDFLTQQELDEVACLISDVKMPGMSGYELQRHLLKAKVHIPTIFIAAHPDDQRCSEALALGAIAFLQKPFDGEELLEWVRKVIRTPR